MSEDFSGGVVATRLACSVHGAKAIAPINRHSVLFFSGDELLLASPEGVETLMKVELPPEKDVAWANRHLAARLIVSRDERFCALVNDYGRYGIVIDLQTRQTTMCLDRGEYHPETTPFPAAFVVHQGRSILIHGTDWNRVDASDPQSGNLLSARSPTSYQEGQERPEHYLDYFHGKLHVSPDGEWILDDGWIWHPMGAPLVWHTKDWLARNLWEAEDGASHKILCYRDYHWDVPMAFLDSNRAAISGLGDDDEEMIAGARVFDVRTGEEVNAFAGPSGLFWSDGRHLLSVEEDGLHLWDVSTGISIGHIDGFRPQFQVSDALVEIKEDFLKFWSFVSAAV